jgi:hypothetical protein
MQVDQMHSLFIQFKSAPKTRMVGCRIAGMNFRGFIGHSKTGFMGDASYRELVCDATCKTPSEAMHSAHDLARTLALRYGYSVA